MEVTRYDEAPSYEAPKHHECYGLRLQGFDVSKTRNFWIAISHFLPGGGDQIFKTLRLPVHIPLTLAAFAIALSVVIGGLTGGLLGRNISKIKPSEVLRHE